MRYAAAFVTIALFTTTLHASQYGCEMNRFLAYGKATYPPSMVWTAPDGKQYVKKSGALDDPNGGRRYAEFSCNAGYAIVERTVPTPDNPGNIQLCGTDGEWAGMMPTCAVQIRETPCHVRVSCRVAQNQMDASATALESAKSAHDVVVAKCKAVPGCVVK